MFYLFQVSPDDIFINNKRIRQERGKYLIALVTRRDTDPQWDQTIFERTYLNSTLQYSRRSARPFPYR